MKTLTLRGIDEELEGRLEELSRSERESMNSLILRLLRDQLGLSKQRFRTKNKDLDDLAGTWTQKDLREFESATSAFSLVDEDLWK